MTHTQFYFYALVILSLHRHGGVSGEAQVHRGCVDGNTMGWGHNTDGGSGLLYQGLEVLSTRLLPPNPTHVSLALVSVLRLGSDTESVCVRQHKCTYVRA